MEKETEYPRELNLTQRLIMEDSLGYIKGLEEKLGAFAGVVVMAMLL